MRTDKAVAVCKALFVRNFGWKALSLAIALVVYFAVRSEISHLRTLTLPVEAEFEVVPGGAVVDSVEPRSVQVTVRGSYSDVNRADLSQAKCVVRPRQRRNALLDVVNVRLRPSHLQGVRGMRVVNIEPGDVTVTFDVPMEQRMAVAEPVTKGKARGRVEVHYDLKEALVKGSRRLMSSLDLETAHIQPDEIDIEGRTQSFVARVKLNSPGRSPDMTVEPAEMTVNVKVTSERETARLEQVPVVISQPRSSRMRWKVVPEYVDVEVAGRSDLMKDISMAQITASVDANIPFVARSGTNEVPVLVHVQQGLNVDEVKAVPERVLLIALPVAPPPVPAPAPPAPAPPEKPVEKPAEKPAEKPVENPAPAAAPPPAANP